MTGNGLQRQSDEDSEQRHPWRGLATADATDANPLGLQDLPSPTAARPWRWLGMFTFVLLSLAMLATTIVVTASRDKKATLLQAEQSRLQESVLGRVQLLGTWLESQHLASRRLTDSHVFRLFVTDLAHQEPALPLPRSLQDQRPYFRQLMADFARQNGLVRATVLREDGVTLLSSSGPVLPVADLLQRLEGADAGWDVLLSPIRRIGDRDGALVVDAMTAFPKAQSESDVADKPSAILVLTLPVGRILEDVLSNRLADPDHEEISLQQQRGDAVDRLSMAGDHIELATDQPANGVQPGMPTAFGRRGDDHPVYSLGEPVDGLPWTLSHALDARAALSPVHDFIMVAAGLSVMAVLLLTAAFSALWWRQGRNHHRRLVELYKAHAHKVDHQRQFLHAVTTSIGDWLTVSAPGGELIYTNPAFETAIREVGPAISGRKWDDLIKTPSADDARRDDLASLIDAHAFDLVEVGGRRRIISPHVSALRGEDGDIRGTVRVVRDHTELVAERQRRLLGLTQTVDAFIQAIELRDPFLLGHTDRVRTHAIAIGERLKLSRHDLASLALAASLSQIGKVFIPDDILAKPDRHNTEEGEIMRDHILHAVDILKRIDFDLPIVDTLAQMHERMDGSGYPHGLAGDQIGLRARILGIADVFCARTAPRSYRDRMSAGKTLYHLASNERRYDLKVVAALAEVVGDGQEIESVDTIERTFIDAAVWREKNREDHRVGEVV
ncbi:MAG: HD domain-containing protein [Alphaproteobacteria bacterium]|nr:HD domain-containing protein [Alphaproteobacteria bacterium]